ncbi:phosphodiester glycosidase family protein [Nocardioides sp. ChNu-99]|uniref:phosphodiester glycosidase family protein n=1 Tax=Nocardioides sp. ChNu-99 TaxID=2839897 RepID=UPI002404B6B8|nr:phosphodiester glycosidase family protein [Nocardioides sp. ChNu-99]MDF9717544.1 phosphodiester glycosidase family protein [Nocardioides sp. ChNu-99]
MPSHRIAVAGASLLLLAVGAVPPPVSAAPSPEVRRPAAAASAAAAEPLRLVNGQMLTRGVSLHALTYADDRGRLTGQVLTVNLSATSVGVEHTSTNRVAQRATLDRLAGGAVAAVNGDFFDVAGTGAPRGFGISRSRGVLHGPEAGWNHAFFLTRTGRVGLGPLDLQARLAEFPTVRVSGVNSPTVADDSVGVYNTRWGATVDAATLTGGDRDVRTAVVSRGRVVLNAPTQRRSMPADGYVLVARGDAASQLLAMPYGRVVTPRASVAGDPAVAVGGSGLLAKDGRVVNRSNTTLAPRTSIAYDRHANRLFLVVVDGRSTRSRGATHYEMGTIATRIGAEDALNLDGGGSTTMLAHVAGRLRLANRPSDGAMRAVPNGIALVPRG